MATWVYPPVPPDELKRLQDETLVSRRPMVLTRRTADGSWQARELQWLLASLQVSLASLKGGLEECVTLLAPREPGSTLVLSSLRSESIKGFVTRVGTKIVKGVS
jgi:Rogdi leucine zipper containing protein